MNLQQSKTILSLLFFSFFFTPIIYGQDSLFISQTIDSLWIKVSPPLYKPDNPNINWSSVITDLSLLQNHAFQIKDTINYLYTFPYIAFAHVKDKNISQLKNTLLKAQKAQYIYDQRRIISSFSNNLSYLWGKYYLYIGNYKSAKKHYKKVIKNYKTIDDFDFQIMDVYNDLGIIYDKLGDYEKAIEHYSYSLKNSPSKVAEATRYQNIAKSYSHLGRHHQQTVTYYHKAIQILKNTNEIELKAIIYNNWGIHYITVNRLDSALFYFNQAIGLQPSQKSLLRNFQERAKIYSTQKQYKLATTDLNKAYNLAIAVYQTEKHPIIADIYFIKARMAMAQKQQKQALILYQKAMISLVDNFDDLDIESHPKLEQISSKIQLLQVLQAKAQALSQWNKLDLAQQSYQKAADLIDIIRLKDIQSYSSKYQLVAQAKTIYEEAIQVALRRRDIATAFNFSQKGHGLLLSQAITDKAALQFAGIPDSLLNKEQELKMQIGALEQNIDSHSNGKEQLFEIRLDYEQLLKKLEQDYPAYYQAKYTIPTASISDIQQKLNNKTALIEYFIGDTTIYTFLITADDSQVFTRPKSSGFLNQIQTIHQSISKFSTHLSPYQNYCTTAYQLYESLLKQPVTALSATVEELIIIPDEELNYIPFTVLLSEKPTQQNKPRYDLLSYFLKDYVISYDYSSALFSEKYGKTHTKKLKTLIGFAPSFSGLSSIVRDGEALNDLLHNKEEVVNIQKIAGGKVYTDTAATTRAFKQEIGQYKIAHIASHATFSDSLPNSSIHFSDGILKPYEIYNLPLNLDLVVLSACETGSGQLHKGEGMVSWAQAFLYSGCPSVVASLWKVNDNTTAQLMVNFYKQLFEGQSKNTALNFAQRQHLEDNISSFDSHPYYWAAFIQIGNTDLVIPSTPLWYWGILGLLIIGLGGWFWARKK